MGSKKPTTSKRGQKQPTPAGKKRPTSVKRGGSTTKGSKNLKAIFAIIFLCTVALAGLFIIIKWPTPPPTLMAPELAAIPDSSTYQQVTNVPTALPTAIATIPATNQPLAQKAKIAIIMDDMGINLKHCTAALNIDIPLTCSIIPGEQYSTQIMELAHRRQHEILIHIPMEPIKYPQNNPGALGLFVKQSDAEIMAKTQYMLAMIPYATGGNNHMGSEFTQHRDKMAVVLREMKKKKLFFIDSLTIASSVAYSEAQRLGVPTAKRNLFLDNDRNVDKILLQMYKLVAIAQKNQHAIGICHPYPATIAALTTFSTLLPQLGVDMVPVAQLVQRTVISTDQDSNDAPTDN